MGQQIGFFAVGRDHDDLLLRCEEVGFVAIGRERKVGSELVRFKPREASAVERFYLLLATLGEEYVVTTPYPADPARLRVVDSRSPVIEFKRSTEEDGVVGEGRLYFAQARGFPGHADAAKAYGRLARTVRRWTPTDLEGVRVGPETRDRVQAGELRLRSCGFEAHPTIRHRGS